MKLNQPFNPLPIAFLLFPFTYALQVIVQSELLGVIPYALLALSVLLVVRGIPYAEFIRRLFGDANAVDVFVLFFLVFSVAHIAVDFVLDGWQLSEAIRFLLIYVGSGWVYCHVSRYATEREIRDIMLAISVAAVVVSMHWVYETYTKTVLHETSVYQLLQFEYIKLRNGFSDSQVNVSVLGPEYRAYGLLDMYTTTGAIVAIGAYATLALMRRATFTGRFVVLGVFFLVLSIGGATTAWLGYVILFPAVMLLSERLRNVRRVMAATAIYATASIALVTFVMREWDETRIVLEKVIDLFSTQLSYVLNFDKTSAAVSWLDIYRRELGAYVQYLYDSPIYAVLGEGYSGYGDNRFPRGGDSALFEFLATFGIPVSLYAFGIFFVVVRKTVSAIRNADVESGHVLYLAFGVAVLSFLVFSLAHYNTLFNKAVFVFLYLALALIRRYAFDPPLIRAGFEHGRG